MYYIMQKFSTNIMLNGKNGNVNTLLKNVQEAIFPDGDDQKLERCCSLQLDVEPVDSTTRPVELCRILFLS